MFVVFDLDGTLADCEHRMDLLRAAQWDDFYRACVHDLPIMPILNTLVAFRAGGARVEIWSGRSDLVASETGEWLRRYCVPPHVVTHMRPHGDHGDDAEMKRRWLYECHDTPNLVFEDRQRVVDMWREEGIQCCQVSAGGLYDDG